MVVGPRRVAGTEQSEAEEAPVDAEFRFTPARTANCSGVSSRELLVSATVFGVTLVSPHLFAIMRNGVLGSNPVARTEETAAVTGYTVHTGSSKKFSQGWDRIFSGSQQAKGKALAGKKPAAKAKKPKKK